MYLISNFYNNVVGFSTITETKTFDKLDGSISNQVANIPSTVFLILLYIIIGWVCIYGAVKVWKLYKAPGSDMIKEYKQNLEKTSADSQQKSLIMTLLDQVNREIPELQKLNREQQFGKVFNHGRKITDMIIEQIPLTLKSMKNIKHRCAVFTIDPEESTQLKIFEGCGFSVQGKDKLRLDISSSTAGKVLNGGEYIYSKDVTKEPSFKPHPKATNQYFSLLCVPIKVGIKTVAVLSIDGSEKDCFSEDDIGYFQMFSNQIAIIFDLMGITVNKGGMTDGEKVQDIG